MVFGHFKRAAANQKPKLIKMARSLLDVINEHSFCNHSLFIFKFIENYTNLIYLLINEIFLLSTNHQNTN